MILKILSILGMGSLMIGGFLFLHYDVPETLQNGSESFPEIVYPYPSELTFLWDQGDNGLISSPANYTGHAFWRKGINCGNPNLQGGPKQSQMVHITFGHTEHVRFPGTSSVEFYTNSSKYESCNPGNNSAHRAEIGCTFPYANMVSIGVHEPPQPGSTVWLGWSEMYTHFDKTHWSTLLQFRSDETGSPASAINYDPEKGINIRTNTKERKTVIPADQIKLNTWYDWILEFRYSFEEEGPNAGFIRVWVYEAGSKDPSAYTYSDGVTQAIKGATLHNNTTNLFPPNQKEGDGIDDGPPHLRWGLYRWASGRKFPEDIDPEDHLFVKYLGPVRMKIGDDLQEEGFESVKPRPL